MGFKFRSSRHQADRDKRASIDAGIASESAAQNYRAQQAQMQQNYQNQQAQYQQQRLAQQSEHNASIQRQAAAHTAQLKVAGDAQEKHRSEVKAQAEQSQQKINQGIKRTNRRRIRGGIFGDSQANPGGLNQRLG